MAFQVVMKFCSVFRRREHQATERDITSLTPCAEGVGGHPTTFRRESAPNVATLLPRCGHVSESVMLFVLKGL